MAWWTAGGVLAPVAVCGMVGAAICLRGRTAAAPQQPAEELEMGSLSPTPSEESEGPLPEETRPSTSRTSSDRTPTMDPLTSEGGEVYFFK